MANSRVELSDFALQLEPPICRELADMGAKQSKVYRKITCAVFQWIADGCPSDRNAYIPAALTAAERGYLNARMDAHIAKWKSHNAHRREHKPAITKTAAMPPAAAISKIPITQGNIRNILKSLGVNPDEKLPYNDMTYEKAIIAEFEYLHWKDEQGQPITSYRAFIQKRILPKIAKCIEDYK